MRDDSIENLLFLNRVCQEEDVNPLDDDLDIVLEQKNVEGLLALLWDDVKSKSKKAARSLKRNDVIAVRYWENNESYVSIGKVVRKSINPKKPLAWVVFWERAKTEEDFDPSIDFEWQFVR